MFKRKWYEWILTIVFFGMVALCVYLNILPDHRESMTTIIVNAVMFVIVAIIFLVADFGSFAPMNSIIKDLKNATEKIRSDALNAHSYLWEPYRSNDVISDKRKSDRCISYAVCNVGNFTVKIISTLCYHAKLFVA